MFSSLQSYKGHVNSRSDLISPRLSITRENGVVAGQLGIILIALFVFTSVFAGNPNICSKVASTTLKACKSDIQDDFWIQKAKCQNTDDNSASEECIKEARTQLHEDRNLCREQKKARLDICADLGEAAYAPEIDPYQFLSPAAIAANPNPYFPLTPGLVRILKSGDETITVTVTAETIEILGVTCIVVRDIVEENGELIEDTVDWYAQDLDGNVWYFGEISKNFIDGELDNLDGSWKAGVAGALPGIIMKGDPQVGDIYRQEYAIGEAEDMAEVISTIETGEQVPAADCSDICLVTRDFLPIEPEAIELKYFAPGVGNILVIDTRNDEREELVEVILP